MSARNRCRVGVSYGRESDLYSFPSSHPLNNSRAKLFGAALMQYASAGGPEGSGVAVVTPSSATEDDLLLFHSREYIGLVREYSRVGRGYLDHGDTPAFKGVYEASLVPVGSTLNGLGMVLGGTIDHFFNPIGGLHHARRDGAGGFCVFNDAAIAINKALVEEKFERVAYIDIDAHHGDGVFYAFESDPRVIVGDIHEDGRFLYPGTGAASETGLGEARGTKLNVPLPPGAGDAEFNRAFDEVETFIRGFNPEFVFLQCGADGLAGDPITHLRYSPEAHAHAAMKVHALAHDLCAGRLLAMGGGGYDPLNVSRAWMAVVTGLCGASV